MLSIKNKLGAIAISTFSVLFADLAHAVVINGYSFDLTQFTGAAVTYRADSGNSVDFDGKMWDNENGVNNYTLGELAAGQFGSDPGDQVTLQSLPDPDWLQLTFGTPILITDTAYELVIHEITSSNSGVDTEGTSFRVKFNGGSFHNASAASSVSHYPRPNNSSESTNQIVFDLKSFGFINGDSFSTLYIENTDSGSGTSDPDFIFAGIAGTLSSGTVPEPTTLALMGLGLAGIGYRRHRSKPAA